MSRKGGNLNERYSLKQRLLRPKGLAMTITTQSVRGNDKEGK